MKTKPKIAVIGLKGLPAFGGAATVGENTINYLKDKYDFIVYSISSHTECKTGKQNGYEQIVFKQNRKNAFNTLVYYMKSIAHSLICKDYDLIHLHHNAVSFLIPILRLKYKVILTTHGLFTEEKFYYLNIFYKISDFIFLRFANYITTVSKEDLRILERIGIKKAIYIPNGVEAIHGSIENNKEKDYLLFAAGRIHEGKGCHIFLRALSELDYNGKIVIAGDLNQSIKYKKHVLKLSERFKDIHFTGMIRDKEKLFSLIRNAKIFIYPSHSEAMSMMMLEVTLIKTPMICCDCSVNRDIFSGNQVLFAGKNDIIDWKSKIEWALNNPDKMSKKAEDAYKLIRSNHDLAKISEQYKMVYDMFI